MVPTSRLRLALARRRDCRGASLIEYALLLALIAVVCVVSMSMLGGGLNHSFSKDASSVAATP